MGFLRKLWEGAEARDFCIVGGLLILAVGAGMVYLPAAPISVGVVLLAIGVWGVPAWP